jgi:hypothetical protein
MKSGLMLAQPQKKAARVQSKSLVLARRAEERFLYQLDR